MSEDKTEQAVVEQTDDQVEPGSEEAGAQVEDALEALLSEYDTETKAPKTELPVEDGKGTTVEDRLARIDQRLERSEKETHEVQFRKDMDVAVKTVRGDLPAEQFDDTLVESYLDGLARDDPRISQAWAERGRNPKRFEQVLTGISRNFAKKFSSLPDVKATEDRDAVTAAVTGASKKAPEGKAPDYSKLSNQEYNEQVQKEHGFDPGT